MADDDQEFRRYLRGLLAREPGTEVVGEAADGAAALALLDTVEADLLLVDLVMPGRSGIAITGEALARWPALRVIVVSLHDDRRMVRAALEAGAVGYLLKDRLDRELSDALAAIDRGQTYLSANLRK